MPGCLSFNVILVNRWYLFSCSQCLHVSANHFTALHDEFTDLGSGFMPQNKKTHTKKKFQAVLQSLFGSQKGSKPDAKFHGKMSGATRQSLAERLSARLTEVMDEGRQVQASSRSEASTDSECAHVVADDAEFGNRLGKSRRARPVEQLGEVPHDAVISAAQAESALGRNLATEWDEDELEQVDDDQRAEEERLMGRLMHPQSDNVDYNLLCWSPDPTDINHAPDLVNAEDMSWPSDIPPRRLTRHDFLFDRESVSRTLRESVDALGAKCASEMKHPASAREHEKEVMRLDPTQRIFYEHVSSWAASKQQWLRDRRNNVPGVSCGPPSLNTLLLGTAGTGKTHTAKLAIQQARRIFGRYGSVLTLAFSGVAAANLGGGSRTIDSVFHTNSSKVLEDAHGEQLDELVAQLGDVELILVDEISTVGAAQFEVMNRRLQQVARVVYRRRFGAEPPEDMGPFGGIGVVLMGDFAQLPPVLATCLLQGSVLVERPSTGLRGLALAGQKLLYSFSDVLRLRRIHRQKGVDAFKESTMRLRDAAITVEDYELWKEHELDPHDVPHWEGGEKLLTTALTLVATNKQAGMVNGSRLASAAPIVDPRMPLAAPACLSSAQVVVRCEARHTNPHRGELRKSDEFRNIRKALHLRVGAKVILCVNFLWDVSTVPLGLMNGARGVIVAIAYAPPGSERMDCLPLAGTGFPQSCSNRFPRGIDQCPVPDFVVVNFPEYTGRVLIPGLPRTWVPIPAEQVGSEMSKSLLRVNIPLRLSWALTFHKCQGITAAEGTVISFLGCNMPAAVSKVGLPFVGWTRATSWSKVAFHGLPPLEEFLAVRTSHEFRVRSGFEDRADSLHEAFLRKCGTSHAQQISEHKSHLNRLLQESQNRAATVEELQDIDAMLAQRGVASLSDSVKSWASTRTGMKSSSGLWSILASFKSSRKSKDVADDKKTSTAQKPSNATFVHQQAMKQLLQEDGHSDELIEAALRDRGSSLIKCQSYLQHIQQGFSVSDDMVEAVSEENWARNYMQELGFSLQSITIALEKADFVFPKALTFLLYGEIDSKRLSRHLQRHVSKKVCPFLPQDRLAHYVERARVDLQIRMTAKDLGMYAGRTTNACFWLSVAAALSRSSWAVTARLRQALPSFQESRNSDFPVRTCDVRHSALGRLAVELRNHMCSGEDAVMLKPYIRDLVYQSFAAVGVTGTPRTLRLFKNWVAKLATSEFADELVVLATAIELSVRIVVVPFTPPEQVSWQISRYPPEDRAVTSNATIYLGNDDVHYVWLQPSL